MNRTSQEGLASTIEELIRYRLHYTDRHDRRLIIELALTFYARTSTAVAVKRANGRPTAFYHESSSRCWSFLGGQLELDDCYLAPTPCIPYLDRLMGDNGDIPPYRPSQPVPPPSHSPSSGHTSSRRRTHSNAGHAGRSYSYRSVRESKADHFRREAAEAARQSDENASRRREARNRHEESYNDRYGGDSYSGAYTSTYEPAGSSYSRYYTETRAPHGSLSTANAYEFHTETRAPGGSSGYHPRASYSTRPSSRPSDARDGRRNLHRYNTETRAPGGSSSSNYYYNAPPPPPPPEARAPRTAPRPAANDTMADRFERLLLTPYGFYEILGVGRDASAAEIKKAYRKLAMSHHPDRNAADREAGRKFQAINEAHEWLSDETKRELYDWSRGIKPDL